MAFLELPENLTPVERAAFLLREVFDSDYAEIAPLVVKNEANCRQISLCARQAVAARRPRFESSPQKEERLTEGFLSACIDGDMEGVLGMLAEDITLWSDGGGKERAILNPIRGSDRVARFLLRILGEAPPGFVVRRTRIKGPTRHHRLLRGRATLERYNVRCREGSHPGHPHPGQPGEKLENIPPLS